MAVVVKWYGRQFDRSVKAHMVNNLRIAAQFLRDTIQRIISTQGPPRSMPWRPPNREFGRLIASFLFEVEPSILTARVGSGMIQRESGGQAPYARYLEFGFTNNRGVVVRPRPHIRVALYTNTLTLGKIIATPMK